MFGLACKHFPGAIVARENIKEPYELACEKKKIILPILFKSEHTKALSQYLTFDFENRFMGK